MSRHRSTGMDLDRYDNRPEPERPKAGTYVSHRQLVERPLTSVAGRSADTPRCWCGRPLRESTGRCLVEHERPNG